MVVFEKHGFFTTLLVMSYSRGAWVGAVIGLLYLAKAYGKLKWKYVAIGAGLVALGAICFWGRTPDSAPWYVKRLDLGRASAQHRVAAWKAALYIMRDHPFGVGWNKTVSTYKEHYSPPEGGAGAVRTNDYLMLGTQLGVPALICFVAYVALCCTSRQLRFSKSPPYLTLTRSPPKESGEGISPSPVTRHLSSEASLRVACRAGALAMLVAFWFDGGLFKLATASVFWILLELGAETRFKPQMDTDERRFGAAKERREHKELELNREPPIANRKSAISPRSALRIPHFKMGFTLVELLVVIAIIGILAGLLMPVLAKAKQKAQGTVCLNNMKQLQLSAILYGNNNNDGLPANVTLHNGGDTVSGKPNWTDGTYSSQPPWNNAIAEDPVGCATNPFYLGVQGNQGMAVTLLGSIGNYAKAAGVYRCPVDQYLDPTWRAPRVRSCSANCFVGGAGPEANGVNGQQNGVNYKVFSKFSDFGGAGLSASDCFVYLDENPLSLNDGWFLFYGSGSTINDKPAINHGMSSSFSFADGHAEFQLWHDVFLDPSLTPGTSGASDTLWLAGHGTYPLQ